MGERDCIPYTVSLIHTRAPQFQTFFTSHRALAYDPEGSPDHLETAGGGYHGRRKLLKLKPIPPYLHRITCMHVKGSLNAILNNSLSKIYQRSEGNQALPTVLTTFPLISRCISAVHNLSVSRSIEDLLRNKKVCCKMQSVKSDSTVMQEDTML